ncbi:ABC-2 transporter permease [Clostridium felsineum]|uniref:ABC-2 transporter permease n=1 Tax=Clostridium felsineum TaxID=36839 RepID=UPI00214D5DC0|nr:ABC-2 transporter permease [Clostridium felsineum]MCR3761200.1 ABC-2 transporter permease [Clostridium felsineum]
MLGFIFKDITIGKRNLIPILLACLTGNLFFIKTPIFIYIVVPTVLMYDYISNLSYYDYRYNSEIMFNSLPVNRKEVVLSKYLSSALFFLLGIVVTAIFTMIFRSLNVAGKGVGAFVSINKWMNLSKFNNIISFEASIFICLLSTIFFVAIYFPIYFKFDFLKVRIIFTIVSIIFSIIPVLILKFIGTSTTYRIVNYINNGSKLIIGVFVFLVSIFIIYISINISIKFYRNKDLKI